MTSRTLASLAVEGLIIQRASSLPPDIRLILVKDDAVDRTG